MPRFLPIKLITALAALLFVGSHANAQESPPLIETWLSTDGRSFEGTVTGFDPMEKRVLFDGERGEKLHTPLSRLSPESRFRAMASPAFAESLRSAAASGRWNPDYQLSRVPLSEWLHIVGLNIALTAALLFFYYFSFLISARWITRDDEGHLAAYIKFNAVKLVGYFIAMALYAWAMIESLQHGDQRVILTGILITFSYLIEFLFWTAGIFVIKSHYVTGFLRAFAIIFFYGVISGIATALVIGAIVFFGLQFGFPVESLFDWMNTRIELWILGPLDLI